VTEDAVTFEFSRHDPVKQLVTSQAVTVDGDGIRMRPVAIRYSWPSELDLMAAQAGLQLTERYSDWDRRPFGAGSTAHVSVYRPA